MDTAIKHNRVNGVDLAYLEKGEGPLVICLHGFPDTAYSFEHTLEVLAAKGYRAVAPFLRGYHPSGHAPDGDYSMPALAADVLALISALGEESADLVGHDWGGFAAYTAANIEPEKVRRLCVMAVPHIAAGGMSLAQLKKSWYVMFFQLPWLPERAIARNDYAFIDRLYRSWSPSWDPKEFKLGPIKTALGADDGRGLVSALAYYRTMIRGAKPEHREIMSRQTTVPSLWFAGHEDGSVGLDQFEGIEQAFTGEFELVAIQGAGHFMHREKPTQVHDKLLSFLSSPTAD